MAGERPVQQGAAVIGTFALYKLPLCPGSWQRSAPTMFDPGTPDQIGVSSCSGKCLRLRLFAGPWLVAEVVAATAIPQRANPTTQQPPPACGKAARPTTAKPTASC